MSVVERTLRRDPGYPTMDFATRDRYRHVVEAIARRSPASEDDVAEAAIRLAGECSGRTAHVGYFLIDHGRRVLERAVAMRRSFAQVVRGACGASRHVVYGGAIAAVTATATIALVARAARAEIAWCALSLCAGELAVAPGALGSDPGRQRRGSCRGSTSGGIPRSTARWSRARRC
jgi:hypothetical protein